MQRDLPARAVEAICSSLWAFKPAAAGVLVCHCRPGVGAVAAPATTDVEPESVRASATMTTIPILMRPPAQYTKGTNLRRVRRRYSA